LSSSTASSCSRRPRTCLRAASCCSRSWGRGSSAASSSPSLAPSPTRSSSSVRALPRLRSLPSLAHFVLCIDGLPSIRLPAPPSSPHISSVRSFSQSLLTSHFSVEALQDRNDRLTALGISRAKAIGVIKFKTFSLFLLMFSLFSIICLLQI
jgi:hypothetical protein